MSRKNSVIAQCHICGVVDRLTYEHVPPASAFNDSGVLSVSLQSWQEAGLEGTPKGKQNQRGAGAYTLCARCNNITGRWYADHFAKWCIQGMNILKRAGASPNLIYSSMICPLNVLKQIITMFFSVNGPEFAMKNPDLVKFVLNPWAVYLPPRYRFFAYYSASGLGRRVGLGGILKFGESGGQHLMSEISFPPFGYVMTIDSPAPDRRLFEITHFSRYDYRELRTVPMHMALLPVETPYPGDYRTKAEVRQDAMDSAD